LKVSMLVRIGTFRSSEVMVFCQTVAMVRSFLPDGGCVGCRWVWREKVSGKCGIHRHRGATLWNYLISKKDSLT